MKRFIIVLTIIFVVILIWEAVNVWASGFTPLPNLPPNEYNGELGGLYPNESNTIPAPYMDEVQAAYDALVLDTDIHFLCSGMSNMKHTCDAMIDDVDSQMSSAVDIGNAGRPGRAIQHFDTETPGDVYTNLTRAGFTPSDVDVVIFFNACALPENQYCGDWYVMADSIRQVYNNLNVAYPNLKLIYFTSREYAPPFAASLNPNPYAYQDGFSYKWAIESRIVGDLSGVPVIWGPYQYDESWPDSYFNPDGIHLSDEGLEVAGALWYSFFLNEPWFSAGPIPTATPSVTPDPNVTPTVTPSPTETPSAEPTATPCTLQPPNPVIRGGR